MRLLVGLLFFILAADGGTAAAQEKLIFATTNQQSAAVSGQVLQPWIDRVDAQGKGVVELDVRWGPSVANFSNFYDRLVNDVSQITWGILDSLGTQFERSSVVGLPLVTDQSERAAVAFWRLYKSGLLDAEYGEIVPLMLFTFSPSGLHLTKPPKTLDTLQGLKLITTSKFTSAVITRMGAAPVTLPLTGIYEALQRGVADGYLSSWSSLPTFKLGEVTFYHVDAALGMNAGALFMAKKRYNALSDAARKVIDVNAGEHESRNFGRFWDGNREENRAVIKAMANHTVVALTPAQESLWRKQAEAVAAEWSKAVPGGERILATYRDLLEQVNAER